jgi:hypothetical protein
MEQQKSGVRCWFDDQPKKKRMGFQVLGLGRICQRTSASTRAPNTPIRNIDRVITCVHWYGHSISIDQWASPETGICGFVAVKVLCACRYALSTKPEQRVSCAATPVMSTDTLTAVSNLYATGSTRIDMTRRRCALVSGSDRLIPAARPESQDRSTATCTTICTPPCLIN